LFQVRPSVIAQWPAWELDLIDQFLDKEPPVGDRIEYVLARMASMYGTVHSSKGTQVKYTEFLLHHNAWPAPGMEDMSDVDREFLEALR
jgi:hypothetical protein